MTDSSLLAGAELERIGYKGVTECRWEANPLKAHFELHIGEWTCPGRPSASSKIGKNP